MMKTLMATIGMVMMATAASVTGTWTMAVEGGPHGNATMGLTLKQENTVVTGTFVSGHAPDMPVKGTFEDGTLKIESEGDADARIIFTAKLKDDGTLAGYLSSPMGDMKWSARKDATDGKDKK